MVDHRDGQGNQQDHLNGEHHQDCWPIDGMVFGIEFLSGVGIDTSLSGSAPW
jgi:hypothetical protein